MSTKLTRTSDPPTQADRLRQEMRTIRRELGGDVDEIVEHAERLMDWRYYVERFPWASVGAALVAGYLVVPGRYVTLPTDERTLEKLAERIPVARKKAEPAKKSMVAGLVSLGTGFLMRAAMGYATQYVQKMMAQNSAPRPVEMHRD